MLGATTDRRTRRLLLLTILLVLCVLQYYVDQTELTNLPFFNNVFFTGVHDLNRLLFLIPTLYAALAFRVRGVVGASLVFLAAVLPRALLFSPYPDPLTRALVFVAFVAAVCLLVAVQLDRMQVEIRINAELKTANQKLSEYARQLKDDQDRLIQAERLSSVGQLAASVAHEVNNPLSGVLTYTQLLIKRIQGDRFSKERALHDLSLMESELTRVTKLVRNLLDFSRQSAPTMVETDLNDVLSRTLELAAYSAKTSKIELVKELDPALPKLMADPNQLQQVFTNLVVNAIQAMPSGGKLSVRTSLESGLLKAEVEDTGCGISPDNMRRLFTPFFSTKKDAKGVGLGLATSYGIVQRHHGRIDVQSTEGKGSTFAVCLPIRQHGGGDYGGKEAEGPAR